MELYIEISRQDLILPSLTIPCKPRFLAMLYYSKKTHTHTKKLTKLVSAKYKRGVLRH